MKIVDVVNYLKKMKDEGYDDIKLQLNLGFGKYPIEALPVIRKNEEATILVIESLYDESIDVIKDDDFYHSLKEYNLYKLGKYFEFPKENRLVKGENKITYKSDGISIDTFIDKMEKCMNEGYQIIKFRTDHIYYSDMICYGDSKINPGKTLVFYGEMHDINNIIEIHQDPNDFANFIINFNKGEY